MIMSDKIPQHSRVQLKNGTDSVYVYAVTGAEGWVRDHKKDEDGFDLVMVEWDKDHWRYNGQSDGWTFAEHFKVIGDPEPPAPAPEDIEKQKSKDEEVVSELLAELVEKAEEMANEDKSPADLFMEELAEAMDAAAEAEGFIMITVRRQDNPENPKETLFAPQINSFSLNEEVRLMLDMQLTECASEAYQEMIYNILSMIAKNRGIDGSE